MWGQFLQLTEILATQLGSLMPQVLMRAFFTIHNLAAKVRLVKAADFQKAIGIDQQILESDVPVDNPALEKIFGAGKELKCIGANQIWEKRRQTIEAMG
jgi:hypothetical protein